MVGPAASVSVGASDHTETPEAVKQRIAQMTEFLETLSTWYEQMIIVPKPVLAGTGNVIQIVSKRPKAEVQHVRLNVWKASEAGHLHTVI